VYAGAVGVLAVASTSIPTNRSWWSYGRPRRRRGAKLRERIGVEHTLARVGQVQGDVARYRGLRKQLFDARRAAAVVNLQIVDALRQTPQLPVIT
jgi:hypothetical protein